MGKVHKKGSSKFKSSTTLFGMNINGGFKGVMLLLFGLILTLVSGFLLSLTYVNYQELLQDTSTIDLISLFTTVDLFSIHLTSWITIGVMMVGLVIGIYTFVKSLLSFGGNSIIDL